MPYKILFARNSGKTFQVDFIPSYDQKGILERTEPVPFRLTRNLHTFFTPFGVEGVFVSAMAAAAQVRPPFPSHTSWTRLDKTAHPRMMSCAARQPSHQPLCAGHHGARRGPGRPAGAVPARRHQRLGCSAHAARRCHAAAHSEAARGQQHRCLHAAHVPSQATRASRGVSRSCVLKCDIVHNFCCSGAGLQCLRSHACLSCPLQEQNADDTCAYLCAGTAHQCAERRAGAC